jgi:DnaJ homolog subfamily C member 14
MKRILKSLNHCDALGFSCHKKIYAAVLKKEYRKKVFIVIKRRHAELYIEIK